MSRLLITDQTIGNSAAATIQRQLIERLSDPSCFPHQVTTIRIIETHISFVILTGPFAYKIKKAIDLGFVDYIDLAQRGHFCREELRLNRRLAPMLYLAVVTIGGQPDAPRIGGDQPVLEYAVKMVEFAQENLLDRVLAEGRLSRNVIDLLAPMIAGFHRFALVAQPADDYGSPETVATQMLGNFTEWRQRIVKGEYVSSADLIARIEHWTRFQLGALSREIDRRRTGEFVRECHGDLHLGNIALIDQAPLIFDCIEFNASLRWCDVMSEIAFLVMDLSERGRPDLAARLLSAYLEDSDDYAGLIVLPLYLVYRAMVRAKVARIRAGQALESSVEHMAALNESRLYLDFASRVTQAQAPALLITHGFSGAGKSFVAQHLVEALGAIRLRSDLQRKRLHGLAPSASSGSGPDRGIYSAAAGALTYGHLKSLARSVVAAGFTVIIDAAFLQRHQRDDFRQLAEQLSVPFRLVDCRAPVDLLYARINQRHLHQGEGGGDISEATAEILTRQLASAEPLADDELADTVRVDSASQNLDELASVLRLLVGRSPIGGL